MTSQPPGSPDAVSPRHVQFGEGQAANENKDPQSPNSFHSASNPRPNLNEQASFDDRRMTAEPQPAVDDEKPTDLSSDSSGSMPPPQHKLRQNSEAKSEYDPESTDEDMTATKWIALFSLSACYVGTYIPSSHHEEPMQLLRSSTLATSP